MADEQGGGERDDWAAQVERAWVGFRSRLADRLAAMEVDEALVVEMQAGVDDDELDGAAPYVQFLCWDEDLIRAEAVSNVYLAERYALSVDDAVVLRQLGWEPPTLDEDGSPVDGDANHHLDLALREADRIAVLAVTTLREVFGCPHPAFLDADGLEAPEDGGLPGPTAVPGSSRPAVPEAAAADEDDDVDDEELAVMPRDHEHLQELVDHAMRRMLGEAFRHDSDGDVPVSSGRSVLYVRVAPDRPAVDLEAEVVCEVGDVDRLLREVDILNREAEFGTFHVEDDRVILRHRLVAVPFAGAQLRVVVAVIMQTLDEQARALAERVEGRRFFDRLADGVDTAAAYARIPETLLALLEMLHEVERVPAAAVSAVFGHDRHEIVGHIVAIRTGRQPCDGLDQELVLAHLRRGLRVAADRESRPQKPLPPRERSQQLTLIADDDGELPLDLERRSS